MLDIDLRYSWQKNGRGIDRTVFQSHYQVHLEAGLISVLGASGEGKSTFLSLLGGFIAGEGSLQFSGKDLLPLTPSERPITSLFQQDNLFPQLTVWQNIAIGLSNNLRLNQAQQEVVEWAIDRTQLTLYAQKKPEELSGGQAQRVAIARAIARAASSHSGLKKSILLLDEPFGALDPRLRMDMMQLVKELTEQLSLTTLLVSHLPEEVKQIGGRFLLIEKGEIILHEPVSALSKTSLSAPLQRYLHY